MEVSKVSLTDREKVILKLMAKGYKNFEIGEITNISIHTVKVHVSSVLKKYNVKTRTLACVRAILNGDIWLIYTIFIAFVWKKIYIKNILVKDFNIISVIKIKHNEVINVKHRQEFAIWRLG